MRVGIFLSTMGGSPLQGGLERGLMSLGHQVESYRHHVPFDLILILNQSAHTTQYSYPDFPNSNIPLAFVDSAEYGYFSRLPNVARDYWNGFTTAAMSHDTKNLEQQTRLKRFLECRSFPYFLRELHTCHDYPVGYHPIDYPLYHLSHCEHEPYREEYLNRSLDLFCSWGASHPWRLNLTEELRAANVKSEIGVIEYDGHERIGQYDYFKRIRAAKCCPSFDGYGSGSFRITEAIVRTVLLNGPMTLRLRDPLIDGETCIEYQIKSNGTEFISSNIVEKLKEVLDDPERSYQIYANGYHHCMQRWTERGVAEYLLRTVESHNWNSPTVI